eukprot:CAMPEP_0179424368 /NCGR_PEP_ID=MMETSP0799-20121207/11545_1 /TAXON_ID=46947 /ORGANISM="Geminigera cryophila, Strain CCMP2564" /LENGTH=85 /DNA_ID=CAMNT_0021198803 /DNA_START=585 /DNA_END=838 /DNA_ORIENTATION=+
MRIGKQVVCLYTVPRKLQRLACVGNDVYPFGQLLMAQGAVLVQRRHPWLLRDSFSVGLRGAAAPNLPFLKKSLASSRMLISLDSG